MPYSAISNAEIDPDSPVTTGLMTKMRDNPEAIALGENGATRIRLFALLNSFVFSAHSTGANIVVPAFQSAPTGGMTILIFLYMIDTENNDGGVTVSVDGGALFTASTNVNTGQRVSDMRPHATSNGQHTISFSSSGTLSATVLAIAS